jgi:hypothetical protein
MGRTAYLRMNRFAFLPVAVGCAAAAVGHATAAPVVGPPAGRYVCKAKASRQFDWTCATSGRRP